MTGVQSLNNFSYEERGLRAWRAYNIGPGKFFTLTMLARLGTPQGATNLTILLPFGRPNEAVGTLTLVRPVLPSPVEPSPSQPDPATQCEGEEDEDRVPFTCPEEGCIKVYQSFAALQRHLDVGKHLIRLERETQYDQVKRKWAETCQSLAGGYLQSVPSTSAAATADQPDNQNMPSAEEGWALKKVRNTVNFSENVRNYLLEVFLLGEAKGHKANSEDVATCMKGLRDSSRKKRFQKKEWLTTVQISRYFSRLSNLNRTGRLLRDTVEESRHADDDEDEDDDDDLTTEATAIRTRQQIRRELEL